MLGVEGFGLVDGGGFGDFFVPKDVAAFLHGDVFAGALVDDNGLDAFLLFEGGVDAGLEGDDFATAITPIGGDDGGGSGVFDAVGNGIGGEAAKDDRVNGTDAGAGEHGDGRFGDHGHVDDDAVLGLDALVEKDVGEEADFAVKLEVGQGAGFAGLAFPDDGGLVAAMGEEVLVEAALADVELAAHEPLGVGRFPVENFGPLFLPGEFLRFAGPEGVGFVDGLLVEALILRHGGDACLLGKLFARFEDAFLLQVSLDIFAHESCGDYASGERRMRQC